MLKRDFIMVQIEELGKVIAQIIFNRNSNDGARKNPELIQSVYTSLKLDNDFLLNTPIDGIRTYLDGDDSCGLQRMELATKTLLEESFLLPEAQGKKLRARAKELLEYIQRNDTTFSLERVALLEEINNYSIDCGSVVGPSTTRRPFSSIRILSMNTTRSSPVFWVRP